jgi:Straboviridae/Ackermannviridae/Kyanoviridae exonuclease subunit 1
VKVAIITDTHFGCRNDHPGLQDKMFKFVDEVFLPRVRAEGVQIVVHGGDVFDRRKYVNFLTAHAAVTRFFNPLEEMGVLTYVTVGNHDCYYRNTNAVNSVKSLYEGFRERLCILEEPTLADLHGLKTLLVPWIPTDDVEKATRTILGSPGRVVIGHLELNGFEMHRGTVCERGMDPGVFKRFDRVWSGHFHTPSEKGNVTYLGAAGQFTWADYDDPRGFHLLDTETLETEFVPNPHEAFHKVFYDGTDESIGAMESAATSGKFVKLIVSDRSDVNKLAAAVDTLESSGLIDLQVVDDHRHADDQTDEDIRIESGVGDTLSVLLGMIDEHVDSRDRERARHLARELHDEAVSTVGDA